MKELRKYLITLIIGLLIAFLVIVYRGTFEMSDSKEILRCVCDGFFVSSICVGGLGLLVFVSNEGAFDILVYGFSSFVNLFRSRKERKYETYYDYRESKAKNKIKSGFILYVGLFLLLVALIIYTIYSSL